MKANFALGSVPPIGKFRGAVYQSYRYGQQVMSTKHNSRSRYPNQWDTSRILIFLARAWQSLTDEQRTAWSEWAAYLPQPSNENPGIYLTGYQNFLKRNYYQLLFFGLNASLITNPALITLDDDNITPVITRTGNELILTYSCSRSGSDIWCGFFVSRAVSAGKLYTSSEPRYMDFAGNDSGFVNNFGLLYNSYAMVSPLNFAPAGWHVMTRNDYFKILELVYGASIPSNLVTISGSNKLRESSSTYWSNNYGTNIYNFNSRGAGTRDYYSGNFTGLKQYNRLSSPTPAVTGYSIMSIEANDNINFTRKDGYGYYVTTKEGQSIRLVADSTTKANAETGTVIGNDGKSYGTIVLNGIEIMSENSCETKFRDGSVIPEITSNSSWAAATTPAMCAYQNNMANAFSQADLSINITDKFIQNFGILPLPGQWVQVIIYKTGKLNGQFFEPQTLLIQIQ